MPITFESPQRVYVELSYYDGPREGIADLRGVPHRFVSHFEDAESNVDPTFGLVPISEEVLALEIEQWRIFVGWFRLFEQGKSTTEEHPAQGKIDSRYDELNLLLQDTRSVIPESAARAYAKFYRLEQDYRYDFYGPDYSVSWALLD